MDQKTVRKYLSAPGPAAPPRRSPSGRSKARLIGDSMPLVDSMLRAEILMKVAVIHGRLAAEHGFTGNYQRVEFYVQKALCRLESHRCWSSRISVLVDRSAEDVGA
ncbi:hypothetical protein [Streptomyces sp. NPDC000931]|uniref:hypothetical protein n=1 Tax=Streptomyces sp. NPDC000931 TaxID=3154372 RepID=UPI003333E43E